MRLPLPACLLLTPFLCSTHFASGAEQLAGQTSSYLKQHYADKVDWMPWGEVAFAKAKKERKPIYLSIGAFTNELSRAMQTQSFGNAKVYEILNRDYVCVLVDRDERPDVAAFFQSYLRSEKQLSGWPANLWLTPDLQPFEGATYLPPSEEWGKEGILNVLGRLTPSWKNSRDSLIQQGAESVASTKAAETFTAGPEFSVAVVTPLLASARSAWLERYRSAHTLLDDPAGHLDPELFRWLLLTPGESRDTAVTILKAIDGGALRDPLDGGFFHRALSASGDFPSFQKFLGDQARLACAFLDAARLSGDPNMANGARSSLDYVLSNLLQPDGGSVHAEDATPEDRVASFAWTSADIIGALGEKEGPIFAKAYGVTPEGNISTENDAGGKWKGRNLLLRPISAGDISSEEAFRADRAKLLAIRGRRLPPLRDENVLIGENGLLLTALARAGAELKEPRYLKAAQQCAAFLRSQGEEGKSHRLLHLAGSSALATAEDYAEVAEGFAELDSAQHQTSLSSEARDLLHRQDSLLFDSPTGRFFAQYEAEPHLWLRTHTLDPLPGEEPSAETATVLAHVALGEKANQLSPSLLKSLTFVLSDASTAPRGDVLLASEKLNAVGR